MDFKNEHMGYKLEFALTFKCIFITISVQCLL